MLPRWIQQRIDHVTADFPTTLLATAYADLSQRYRSASTKRGFQSYLETVAYVGARLPATYACVQRCLNELPDGYSPASTLDVGSGPGTATLACMDRFDVQQTALIEENQDMVKIGQHLVPLGQWSQANLLHQVTFPKADLVLFSYVLNELPEGSQRSILNKLWDATGDHLLIITTGTPAGFEQLRQARQHLIEAGAFISAPCPHLEACPMLGNDWCHFSIRLNRSTQHKKLKSASLGYEDEKFSYLLLSKQNPNLSYSRVIKQPQHKTGHGTLDLCTKEGKIKRLAYSKSKTPDFQQVKALVWGDKYSDRPFKH